MKSILIKSAGVILILILLVSALVGCVPPVEPEHTHSYEWVTDLEATFDAPGYKHKECECGHIIEENTEIPADKSSANISEDLLLELYEYVRVYTAHGEKRADSFKNKMNDITYRGYDALFTELDPEAYYFVAVYLDQENPESSSGYYPYINGFHHDLEDGKKDYLTVAYKNAEDIKQYYDGKTFLFAFQINYSCICYDILDESRSFKTENIGMYYAEFVDGVNVAERCHRDEIFIRLDSSDSDRKFSAFDLENGSAIYFKYVERDGKQYVAGLAYYIDTYPNEFFSVYADAFLAIMEEEKYTEGKIEYYLFPLDGVVELIRKAKNGEHIHNYISDYNDSSHFSICSCGEKIDVEEHSYEWVTDIEPTYTTPGVKHKECDCGDKTEDNTVAERLIHSDELTDGAIDPSMYTHEIFNSFSELNDFCSGNKEKLGGAFVCLDLLSAKDDGISVQTQYAPPPYAFDYEEEKDDKYINSKLITYYELYIKELGTDTDINEDVPYHSITLELISTASQQLEGNITYEFFRYNDSKTMWNYVVRIYSDNRCIAEMYYYTGLDINREWIASFLDEYIIKMD